MFFCLTILSLEKFIKKDVPILPDETPENERFLVTEAWKHSDLLCKNYILSRLEEDLYNVYSNMEKSKELWIALEKKYKTEDVRLKKLLPQKFWITKCINYIIITNIIFIEGLVINEVFQVAGMIAKLPPLWKDLKYYLKHKREEMLLEDLIFRLMIEKDNKVVEENGRENSIIIGANIVEDAPQNNKKRKNPSRPKSNPSKKRLKGNFYNCRKAGHKSADCRAPKKDKKKGQANMIEKHEDIDDLCAMLSECNLVGNPKEW
ncbi:uncharacterized protein [Nicotiana sylvestris]|uniref:uncharacterized protein n=1 Tax=Nicotiana sylvestris TaxID=4096 RepID=UPI00388C3A93